MTKQRKHVRTSKKGKKFYAGGLVNPWAVATARVGRKDKKKYESVVRAIKEKNIEEYGREAP